MKRFNITKGEPVIFGLKLPSMSVYGCYPLTYWVTRKVTDKHGNVHKRRIRKTRDCYYVVTDYKLDTHTNKCVLWFMSYDERHNAWVHHNTAERKIYQQLFDFVYPLIERNKLYDVTPTHKIPANVYPQEKKAQVWADSCMDFGSIGYVLNSHVMTDDVVKKPFVNSYKKR